MAPTLQLQLRTHYAVQFAAGGLLVTVLGRKGPGTTLALVAAMAQQLRNEDMFRCFVQAVDAAAD
jgi:hypothetical protein